LPSLQAARSLTGIDLDGPAEVGNIRILKGNANSMSEIADNSFDVVLSNSVLEHDA